MAAKIGQDHLIEVENKISDLIYDEINFNFGETLDEEVEFSNFCDLQLRRGEKDN